MSQLNQRPLSPSALTLRMEALRRAVNVLLCQEIQILALDLNRDTPVIEISDLPRNQRLGPSAVYRHSRDARGAIARHQVQLEGCRVEWDRIN
ncbi:MAG: hypothetical protein H7842_12840 [Gammaproteobacteria bacterium SHHR-1]